MGRRLRIAFVVHDYNRYMGHSRYVAELSTRFRHDHEVHVFANRVDTEDREGITFHHVPAWRRNALATIVSFILPATLAIRGKFDIVHAQGLCGLRHNLATAHFCQAGWFDALARQRVRLSGKQTVFRAAVTPLERQALSHRTTGGVIAVSQRIASDLSKYYLRTNGVRVIYHGTDTRTFHPKNRERFRIKTRSELGISDGQFVAMYAGDLQKGAAAAIRATAATSGVALALASKSPVREYLRLAESLGVSERVVFVPFSKRIESLYAAADCFVFPTVYEPFGLVITEAMASGLPVITSRAAGAAELISDGVDGLLTGEPWDVPAIAERLARLRDDRELRERIGSSARVRIEPFTWDRTASETLDVYRDTAEIRA